MEKFGITLPGKKLPVYIIGAGGIVNDAHLPAYKLAEFEVSGIFDINAEKAKSLATKFGIKRTFERLSDMVQSVDPKNCVFDVAVPGGTVLSILKELPAGSHALIQKPMGENLKDAQLILELCREKNLNAGINFQMRYAPFINEARKIISQGLIGDLCDLEVQVNVFTPWHLWDFLFKIPRMEILYHSIHYVDLIRSFFGNPERIYARTVKHPLMMELASVRTTMIMDYGEVKRANILTNHCHDFGMQNQNSYVKLEGTKGCVKISFGVLQNYPAGVPDKFEYVSLVENPSAQWQIKDIEGTWFPHAFIGTMSQIMRAATGEIDRPDNTVEDCIHTMACVEAAYQSSEYGGTKLP